MTVFLDHQEVQQTERRRKIVRRLRKRIERISLIILIWCGGIGVLFGGYLAVMVLPIFTLEATTVHGDLRILDATAVARLAAASHGTQLFRIPVREVAERIGAHPWVAETAVRRQLPHTLWIYVSERSPAALLNLNGLYLVDDRGIVFKPWDPADPSDLPVISGVTDVRVGADGLGRSAQLAVLLRLKMLFERSGLGEDLECAELILDRPQGQTIVTAHPTLFLRLGEAPDNTQLERLRQVLPMIAAEGKQATVDLRVDRRVIVHYGS